MLANNPALSFLGFLFLAGALLFALGSWLARKSPESKPSVSDVPVLELIVAEMSAAEKTIDAPATEAQASEMPAVEPPAEEPVAEPVLATPKPELREGEVPEPEALEPELPAFAAPTAVVRSLTPMLPWTHAVAETDEELDPAMRLDIIERLAMVGAPWCVDALNAAIRGERDEALRDAADRALLVIACRPE